MPLIRLTMSTHTFSPSQPLAVVATLQSTLARLLGLATGRPVVFVADEDSDSPGTSLCIPLAIVPANSSSSSSSSADEAASVLAQHVFAAQVCGVSGTGRHSTIWGPRPEGGEGDALTYNLPHTARCK